MADPTCRTKRKSIRVDLSSSQYVKFSATVDEKGRICLPSGIRKTLGINFSDKLDLILLTSQNKVVLLKNGCGDVADNIAVCEPLSQSSAGRGPRKRRQG